MSDETHANTTRGSQVFSAYRAVGFLSNHVPCVYETIGADHFLITAIGKSFHVYNCEKLNLRAVGTPLADDVTVMCLSRNREIAVGARNIVYIFQRGKIIKTYAEHKAEVFLILKLADHLISIDRENNIRVWCNKTLETYLDFTLDKETFTITACIHPITYLNKILFASKQGKMQLWNIRTNTLIHEFKGWEEPILVLEQAPAVDVVAVGLRSGHIVLYNIKYEKKLMSFHQDVGVITGISFRTDGVPIMASASSSGHLSFWDLEKKRTIYVKRHAHSGSIAGLRFLYKQPVLVSTGTDNAIKMWIFDNPDGSCRLLRSQCGHSLPPTRTLFHGPSGKFVLSSGMDNALRFSSLYRGNGFEFNQGHVIKMANQTGQQVEDLKMPPITFMAAEHIRSSDWNSIVTCHLGVSRAISWSLPKRSIGSHNFSGDKASRAIVCDISSCGNFVVVGYSDGKLKKFNMQSGADRGNFRAGRKKIKNHTGAIRGVSINNMNSILVSTSADKSIKFWNFKSKCLYESIECDCSISQSKLHRDSSLLAVSFDDFKICLYDIDTRNIVRKFFGHRSIITDICWSPDARWVVSCSLDGTIKTWDVPSARLVDCFGVDEPATSVSFSPSKDLLVTTHQDNLGIYLWANKVLFSGINPTPLPEDFKPNFISLPTTEMEKGDDDEKEEDDEVLRATEDVQKYVSPEQIGQQLVTLSMLPESRWRNLVNLDLIKLRNKPKEPPKKPKAAPFFLPTVAGVETTFDLTKPQETMDDNQNRISSRKVFESDSPVVKYIKADGDDTALLSYLKQLTPSELETEFRLLSPDLGGNIEHLSDVMKCFSNFLKSGKDYELVQAFVSLFLKLYGDLIPNHDELRESSEELLNTIECTWSDCQAFLHQSTCLIKYFKSATV